MSCRQKVLTVCALLLSLAGADLPAAALVAPVAATAVRKDVNTLETEVRQGINNVRREHGLTPLQDNAALARIAREYSRRMAKENFFAHEDPQGRTLVDRLEQAGIAYRVAAENILTMTNIPDPVNSAIKGWMNSQGHRANILRKDVTETGVGIWREGDTFYFTQVFLRPPQ